MGNKIKDIDIKNWTDYFSNDIIIIKILIRIDEIDEMFILRCSYSLYWICNDQKCESCKN